MLVLTRKSGERIYIGPGIWLTVLEMKRNAVRIGIEAPEDIEIMREELVAFAQTRKSSEASPEPGPTSDLAGK